MSPEEAARVLCVVPPTLRPFADMREADDTVHGFRARMGVALCAFSVAASKLDIGAQAKLRSYLVEAASHARKRHPLAASVHVRETLAQLDELVSSLATGSPTSPYN